MERDKAENYIVFTSENFPEGGPGATYVNLLCKGITELGGNISVYLFKGFIYKDFKEDKGRKHKTSYGVGYTYLGFAKRPDNKLLKIVEELLSIGRTCALLVKIGLKRKRPTVFVYSPDLLFNIPVYLISKIFGIKTVTFICEYVEYNELRKMTLIDKIKARLFLINFHSLSKLSDKIISFSSFLRDKMIEGGFDGKDIFIQPNLTNLAGWEIADSQIKYSLGYAGTPTRKDGVVDLLTAVKILKEQGTVVNVLIIGDTINKESVIPHFQNLCEELGISNQVTFTGLLPQSEVKERLNECLILSITRPDTIQTRAGFPTKLGEYMACKRIVLATRFGDIERYFSDKTSVVLAEPESPVSIANSIAWILANKTQSERIAENAFDKATEVLDYRKGSRKIVDFVKS